MTTQKQKKAARKNIKKAQKKWASMSSKNRARSQPEGRSRMKPGAGGSGKYYRIVVRSKTLFTSFRNHDVGQQGHIQRIAGHKKSGGWATQAWLVSKHDAHRVNGHLSADSADVKKLVKKLGGTIEHVKGDIFKSRPRKNIPEKAKPTAAQKRARRRNIKKAQKARHK